MGPEHRRLAQRPYGGVISALAGNLLRASPRRQILVALAASFPFLAAAQGFDAIFEAEDATLQGAVVANEVGGFTGTGYADYINATGDFVEWTVSVPSAGAYGVEFRYGLSRGDRPLEIAVNAVTVDPSLSFPSTGSFTNWGTVGLTADLTAGQNTIRATAVGSSGGNLDHLRVVLEGSPPPIAAPSGLVAAAGDQVVGLDWSDNTEPALSHYNVHRATVGGGPYLQIQTNVLTSDFSDTSVTNNVTYYYVVTAVDNLDNESANSNQATATPSAITFELLFEAEEAALVGAVIASDNVGFTGSGFVDYRNSTGDSIEWNLNVPAAGTYTCEFRYALRSGDRPLQVEVNGLVVEPSLSFPATGSWSSWDTATLSAVGFNAGSNTVTMTAIGFSGANVDHLRVIGEGPAPDLPPAAPADFLAMGGNGVVLLDWDDNIESDLLGYNVYRAATNGGPYEEIATLVDASQYLDAAVTNGLTYYYVVTAVDDALQESGNSNEEEATPAPISSPTSLVATAGSSVVFLDWDDNTEPDLSGYNVYRSTAGTTSEDFTIVVLPDTQYYSELFPEVFESQTSWIVANREALNIVFVTHLGDCVEHHDLEQEWINADAAMSLLEDPLTTLQTEGIPYGVVVGNHDNDDTAGTLDDQGSTTSLYNQYFGVDRFDARGYYGGHFGTNNDNHYELFSAGGMEFVAIHLEYDESRGELWNTVLEWADDILKTHSDRRAIVSSHYLLASNATFSGQGADTHGRLKENANLFLMLCGHVVDGAARRSDEWNGQTVYTILSDFQNRSENGGNGWLRIMRFSPAGDEIQVETYSPWLDEFKPPGEPHNFVLAYDMDTPGAYEQIAANLATSEMIDDTVSNGVTYFYVVTAVDSSLNESSASNQVETTPEEAGDVDILLEAEDAVLVGPVVDTVHPGFTGTGFADYINPSGDYIEWNVAVPTTTSYSLEFRYALKSGDRPLEIDVNSQTVEPSLAFPATGSWTNWQTVGLTVTLTAGVNSVRATAVGASGANVDSLRVH